MKKQISLSKKKKIDETRKVIDADNMELVETFFVSQTENKLRYYESLGEWEDVSIDRAGDIILWKDL